MIESRFPLSFSKTGVLLISGMLTLLGGCSQFNMRQLAYEVLRQEDCRRNQLDSFCTRTFAREYLEYERVRQDFIRSQQQHAWRVNLEEATLPPISDSQ
jgi:hypothetical protein